ncbi:hypothetical protein J6590_018514 [Homalodisca vitripennis]|nr:hypothetical protein J6590_018514 [Homalodisca vitripennis]
MNDSLMSLASLEALLKINELVQAISVAQPLGNIGNTLVYLYCKSYSTTTPHCSPHIDRLLFK